MLNPVLEMMDGLSIEDIKVIMEKAKERINISPQVKKLLSLVEKLNEEDRYQFLLNLKHSINGKHECA